MALRELVDQEHECGWLLECVDGCSTLDREIFFLLLDVDGKRTVDEIAGLVDRERSTTYRSLRRLEEQGYLEKEQRTYDSGGFCYRYGTAQPDVIFEHLEATITDCQRQLDTLLAEFRRVYCDPPEA